MPQIGARVIRSKPMSTPRKCVLLIGLHPRVVDFSQFPGLDAAKLTAGLDAALAQVIAAGFDAEWCLTAADWAAAGPEIRARLAARPWAAILIGAGIRTPAVHVELFERIVDLVRSEAPGARLCFNTAPDTTVAAVLRWLPRALAPVPEPEGAG